MIPFIHEMYCDNCDKILEKVNDREKIKERKNYFRFSLGTQGFLNYSWENKMISIKQGGDFCSTKCFSEWIEKQIALEAKRNNLL